MVQSGIVFTNMSPSLGLVLQKLQVSGDSRPGMLGWGKMLSAVCEQWEGLILPALSATNLVVAPWLYLSVGKVCCCHFLLAFAWFPQRWPSARPLCSLSSHQLAELIYFPSPLAPAHLRKRWRQIFSIRGKPLNVLASGCCAAVSAPSEILLQFSMHSLREAGSGE